MLSPVYTGILIRFAIRIDLAFNPDWNSDSPTHFLLVDWNPGMDDFNPD